ncbi:hypothetical protein [Mesorhizobium sp. M0684]|uniref:hypothetical protein n=1 Tax=Mesorhizobium sp. M0684 TaxID=2956986 RepID=UPI00333681D4
MTQQNRAGVRGDGAAVEAGDNFITVEAFKFELPADRPCASAGPVAAQTVAASQRYFDPYVTIVLHCFFTNINFYILPSYLE